ncbi:MAG: iron-sulfur cluster assembly scaffold protein [Rhodocyclales bacterium]|nr:iron-sulfur cluster assembly scaffold protein [Rhodocyclales bacterium]
MSDGLELYQDAIKRLANAAYGASQLASADGEAKLNNPLCGDRVVMQVALSNGHITAIAHQTKGCLLCKAAASLLGARGAGLDAAAIDAATDALEALLHGQAAAPADWPELAMFRPAHAYPSRHKCALLPFHALQAAMRSRIGDTR